MRRNASCWSSSGAHPKAWTPSSATCRTKSMKSEGPQPGSPIAPGYPTSSWALCFCHRSPGSTLAKSLSGCVFTPRVVSIPRVLWLFLIGLILCNGGKCSTLGLPMSLSRPALELSRVTASQGSAGHCWPSPPAETLHHHGPEGEDQPPPSSWLRLCLHSASNLRWGHHGSLMKWSGTRGQSS